MSEDLCTLELITNAFNRCTFVTTNCDSSFINFLGLHYCQFEERLWLTIPTYFFVIIFSFYVIGTTSDKYLSGCLTKLSSKLNLSQNLTGLTFLAFANGAPDVISSIVAGDDMDGLPMSIGALLGSGVFLTTVVLGIVIFIGKDILLQRMQIMRDLTIFILTVIFLSVLLVLKKIHLWQSILLFSFYFILVISAYIIDKTTESQQDGNEPVSSTEPVPDSEITSTEQEGEVAEDVDLSLQTKPSFKSQKSLTTIKKGDKKSGIGESLIYVEDHFSEVKQSFVKVPKKKKKVNFKLLRMLNRQYFYNEEM